MSTHNICFRGEIRKIFTWYPLLSGVMEIPAFCCGSSKFKFSDYFQALGELNLLSCKCFFGGFFSETENFCGRGVTLPVPVSYKQVKIHIKNNKISGP